MRWVIVIAALFCIGCGKPLAPSVSHISASEDSSSDSVAVAPIEAASDVIEQPTTQAEEPVASEVGSSEATPTETNEVNRSPAQESCSSDGCSCHEEE